MNKKIEGFGHLHVHTEFSTLDGMAKINELVARAKELGQQFIAITDHGSCAGHFQFEKVCIENNIKPIIFLLFILIPF